MFAPCRIFSANGRASDDDNENKPKSPLLRIDNNLNGVGLRVSAYRQRFEERKQMRANKHVTKMTVDELMDTSWGGVELSSDVNSINGGCLEPENVDDLEQAPTLAAEIKKMSIMAEAKECVEF